MMPDIDLILEMAKQPIARLAAIIVVAFPLSACVSSQSPTGQEHGYVQAVRSGVKTRGGDYATIGWDGRECRALLPEVAIIRPPLHGSMTIERGFGRVNPSHDGARTPCTGNNLPAVVIHYQSKPGYRGEDRGIYGVRYRNGQHDVYDKLFRVQ